MGERMSRLAAGDLIDRFEAVLPRTRPADTARRVLEVMRRISRATEEATRNRRTAVIATLEFNGFRSNIGGCAS